MNQHQDREMAQIIAHLSLLSYGSTTAWNASGTTGKPGSRILHVAMLGEVAHEHYRDQYNSAATDHARDEIITDARRHLHAELKMRKVKVREETWAQLRERIVKEGEGWSASDVASALKTMERMVRKARVEMGHDPDTGLQSIALMAGARKLRARELVEMEGCSARTAAFKLGVSYKTVLRDLGRAA